MTILKETQINLANGEITEKDLTAAEAKTITDYVAQSQAAREAELQKITAKAALLERLGITADEAALLLS